MYAADLRTFVRRSCERTHELHLLLFGPTYRKQDKVMLAVDKYHRSTCFLRITCS